ncbi:MAG: xylan 1,4-beta-xylosidase, partial [Muribaculaceae bacterium]|nr:xylan 1,4-beta-xylosidase [Muribaculaceae bacterium]
GQWGFGGWEYNTPIDLSGYNYIVAELNEEEHNGVELRVFDTASYWETPYTSKFNGGKLVVGELNGMMKNLPNGSIVPLNTAEVYRVGFWAYGGQPIHIKHVFATNDDPYSVVAQIEEENGEVDNAVYNMMGAKVADSLYGANLSKGLYVCAGKKILMK